MGLMFYLRDHFDVILPLRCCLAFFIFGTIGLKFGNGGNF